MASEDFSEIDFTQFENEFLRAPKRTIDDGFSEITQVLLEDIVHLPKRDRATVGESGVKMLEKQFFEELLCRQLAITANRALTVRKVIDDLMLEGEDLEGPLSATGIFTGLTFLQIVQYNYEPIIGLEIGEYQIISGDRPESITRRLLVPLQDVGPHQFD